MYRRNAAWAFGDLIRLSATAALQRTSSSLSLSALIKARTLFWASRLPSAKAALARTRLLRSSRASARRSMAGAASMPRLPSSSAARALAPLSRLQLAHEIGDGVVRLFGRAAVGQKSRRRLVGLPTLSNSFAARHGFGSSRWRQERV